MKLIALFLVVGLFALPDAGGATQAQPRRGSAGLVEQETPLAAVRTRAGELGVRLYFGADAPPAVSRSTGDLTSEMHERTVESRPGTDIARACREALYDAAADLAAQARAMGANAVVEVDSGYAPDAPSTGARFLCRTALQQSGGRRERVLGVRLTGRGVVLAE